MNSEQYCRVAEVAAVVETIIGLALAWGVAWATVHIWKGWR